MYLLSLSSIFNLSELNFISFTNIKNIYIIDYDYNTTISKYCNLEDALENILYREPPE